MDLKLDTSWDVDLTTGDLVLLEGAQAISQHIQIRLKFYLAEWYLDQRVGMPYFQTILVKGAKLDVIREIFNKAILETPGVESVSSLDLTYNGTTRVLTVTFNADIVGADEPVSFEEEFIL